MTRKAGSQPGIPEIKIVLVGRVAAHARELLESHLENPCRFVSVPDGPKAPELAEALADADVIVGDIFTADMGRAAAKLKLFHAVSAGTDHHDFSTLPPLASVANVYGHGPAIGEFVMLVILALSRRLLPTEARFRQGHWDGCWIWGDDPTTSEVEGRVLGLVGYGNIGREVARRATAFGMRIQVIRSGAGKSEGEEGLEFCGGPDDFEEVASAADFLVLACPLNDKTRGWMGARELGWLKPTAYLVNVARGPIVDEEALFEVLREKRIAGAALDVWYRYPTRPSPWPPSKFPFEKLENVLMTPHISGWTSGTRRRRFRDVAANLDRLMEGKPLQNVVVSPREPSLTSVGEASNAGRRRSR